MKTISCQPFQQEKDQTGKKKWEIGEKHWTFGNELGNQEEKCQHKHLPSARRRLRAFPATQFLLFPQGCFGGFSHPGLEAGSLRRWPGACGDVTVTLPRAWLC